jgi:predicted dehydrogenase
MKNLALIGCGYWGKNYVNTLKNILDLNLKYVVESATPKTSIPEGTILTEDYEKVLSDKDIDGIIVVTPTITHYDLTSRALNAGKNVLVEKPMATNSKDAKSLCKIAEKNNVNLMVGHIFKYNIAVKEACKRVKRGDLGHLRYIESRRVGLGPIRQDVDVVWDFATHDIYIANMLVGKMPQSVSCQGISHNGSLDDIASLNLKYSDPSILATIYVNWEHPVKERTTIIGGSEKAILFNDMEPSDKIIIFDRGINYLDKNVEFGSFQAVAKQGDTLIPKLNLSAPLQDEIEHFGECIKGSVCLSDGYDGADVVRILEAADESRKKGGLEIKL